MRIIDHKMKMIRHEAPRRNADPIADKLVLEQREHPIAIFIVFEDADATVASRNNVVIARQGNDSTRSWHIALPSQTHRATSDRRGRSNLLSPFCKFTRIREMLRTKTQITRREECPQRLDIQERPQRLVV